MGWKYEVEGYTRSAGQYQWITRWAGDSKRQMKQAVRDAREQGCGAVRVTYRGVGA